MEDFTKEGFKDVGKIMEWKEWINTVPTNIGVYAIINKGIVLKSQPFKEKSPVLFYNEKPLSYSTEKLKKAWETSNHQVLYIGKTEGKLGLKKRISNLMKFGEGENTPHRAGRSIWQIENCKEFNIYYCVCDNPEDKKKLLIQEYNPFANKQKN